mmetsp:Transcript_73471/g.210895  ORF Transcript_73471/g.210895 Transcript_73471/m.210895 type:complete len:227 (+) Transcript_73471:362-1042(+)
MTSSRRCCCSIRASCCSTSCIRASSAPSQTCSSGELFRATSARFSCNFLCNSLMRSPFCLKPWTHGSPGGTSIQTFSTSGKVSCACRFLPRIAARSKTKRSRFTQSTGGSRYERPVMVPCTSCVCASSNSSKEVQGPAVGDDVDDDDAGTAPPSAASPSPATQRSSWHKSSGKRRGGPSRCRSYMSPLKSSFQTAFNGPGPLVASWNKRCICSETSASSARLKRVR